MKRGERHVPVTEAALLKRINRRLAQDEKALRKARGAAARSEYDWLHIDLSRGTIVGRVDDLAAFARALDVLHPWETLAGGRARGSTR